MCLALFLLRFLTVNQCLRKYLYFLNHVFAFEIDQLRLVSGILWAVFSEDVFKQFLYDALLLLSNTFLTLRLRRLSNYLHL